MTRSIVKKTLASASGHAMMALVDSNGDVAHELRILYRLLSFSADEIKIIASEGLIGPLSSGKLLQTSMSLHGVARDLRSVQRQIARGRRSA